MVEPQIVVLVVAGSSPVGHPSAVPVAQPDRASDFGSEGWGFESLQARVYLSTTYAIDRFRAESLRRHFLATVQPKHLKAGGGETAAQQLGKL